MCVYCRGMSEDLRRALIEELLQTLGTGPGTAACDPLAQREMDRQASIMEPVWDEHALYDHRLCSFASLERRIAQVSSGDPRV